ncbi:MAG: M28 family peptidase, partial [Vicinamibacteria bacterium]
WSPRWGTRTILFLALSLVSWHALSQKAVPPVFDGGRALADVERLVAFGARSSGSEAHRRAQEFLLEQLAASGFELEIDDFTARTPVGPIAMSNLIAVRRGTSEKRILVAGHYDTKRFDDFTFVGANDGGSSAAVVLELARALVRLDPPLASTVWLVLLDGEEAIVDWSDDDSLYGSRHLASRLEATGEIGKVGAFLLVDMVGDRELGIVREMRSTPWLQDLVWAEAQRLGHGEHFLESRMYIDDDHLPFAQRGVPVIDLIDFEYGPVNTYWHSPEDTLDKLSAASLSAVGETLLGVLPEVDRRLNN